MATLLNATSITIAAAPLPVVVRPVMDPELEECRSLVNKAVPTKRFVGDGRPLTRALADELGIPLHKPYLPPCEHDKDSSRACCPVPRGLVYDDAGKPIAPKSLTKAEADRLRSFADEAREKPADWYPAKDADPHDEAESPESGFRLPGDVGEIEVA